MKKLIKYFAFSFSKLWICLPRQIGRGFFSLLGYFWFDILRLRRKLILQNIAVAFPDMPMAEKIQLGRTCLIRNTGQVSDLISVPAMDKKWIEANVLFSGLEHLDAALKEGKGVYLLASHLGSPDLIINALQINGYPIHLISKKFKSQTLSDFWFMMRGAQGVQFIEAHSDRTGFDILRAIRQKEIVIFVLDQHMGRPYGVKTKFFGKEAGTAYGLALFSLKTKSPVVPICAFETDDGRLHIEFEQKLDLQEKISENKDETIKGLTQLFTDQIEKMVRRHPKEWIWMHRRWKNTADLE